MQGRLSIVATPIGNLEDITLRALRVFKEADYILAEDTRVTMRLLSHYDLHTKVVRLDAHKERESVERIMHDLEEGKHIALVSDAGTPTVSDPGVRLVSSAREAGVRVDAIPGPSSLTAALSISGLPAENLLFLGFVPHKKGRQTFLKGVVAHAGTAVFFESTHRIMKLLGELSSLVGDERHIVLARELTKMYEEVLSGSPSELLAQLQTMPEKQKGEFVVLFSPVHKK